METLSTLLDDQWFIGISASIVAALVLLLIGAIYRLFNTFLWWHRLRGAWKSSYQSIDDPSVWFYEDVTISMSLLGGLVITSRDAERYTYKARAQIEGKNYLYGKWVSTSDRDKWGHFNLTIDRNYLFGYWAGTNDTTGGRGYGRWCLGKEESIRDLAHNRFAAHVSAASLGRTEHGLALIANRDISPNAEVVRSPLVRVPQDEWKKLEPLLAAKYVYTNKLEGDELVHFQCMGDAAFVNHSETPNLIKSFETDQTANWIVLSAGASGVSKGEELTISYFNKDWFNDI